MTIPSALRRAPFAALSVAAAVMLAGAGAHAQGTDAQREACAPDAVNLCQDTIPDVPKTTACMKAHFAQLSPRCQKEFSEATGTPRRGRGRVAKGEAGAPPRAAVAPDVVEVAPAAPAADREAGMGSYEDQIRADCKQGLIDPFTCRNTLEVLRGIQ